MTRNLETTKKPCLLSSKLGKHSAKLDAQALWDQIIQWPLAMKRFLSKMPGIKNRNQQLKDVESTLTIQTLCQFPNEEKVYTWIIVGKWTCTLMTAVGRLNKHIRCTYI